MKLCVIYHSQSGNTARMAQEIVRGIQSVEGMEARAFSIDETIDHDYVAQCSTVIIGTPTYNGTLSGKMKLFLESAPKQYGFAGKLGGAFATANYIHGGGDIAIQCVLLHLMCAGMAVYSGGGAYGVPVIHLGPVAIASDLDAFTELFRTYGARMAQETAALFD